VAATIKTLGTTTDDTGRVLAKAIDQATAAASTARAVDAVVDRIKELGKTGALTGDALEQALQKATAKADSLRDGINSLDEALRTLGLKSQAEVKTTADRYAEAYARIQNDSSVSIQAQIDGFVKYRDSAVAAGRRIEGSQVDVAGKILSVRAEAAGMGTVLAQALNKGKTATDVAGTSMQRYTADIQAATAAGIGLADVAARVSNAGNLASAGSRSAAGGKYDGQGFALNKDGSVTTGGYQVPVPPGYSYTLDMYAPGAVPAGYDERGRKYPGYFVPTNPQVITSNPWGFGPNPAAAPRPAPVPAPAVATPSSVIRVDITAGSQSVPVTVTDQGSADNLIRALHAAARSAGATL
jgi:hypothetical protein